MVFEVRERAARSGRGIAEEAGVRAREAMERDERLIGFGHRVYKVRDPRALVLADAAERLFARAGDPRLYEDARAVEQAVLGVLRQLKPGRRIETNVEFYTALVLHGVGLGTELFTPTFAVSRVGGWVAHVLEQIDEDRLIRPSAAYVGSEHARWVPIESREPAGPAGGRDGAPRA